MLNFKSCIVITGLVLSLFGTVPYASAQSYYQGDYGGNYDSYGNYRGYDDGYYNDRYEYYGNGIGGGYGYQNNDGSWYHQGSDYSGGYSVGGDASGCIYTPNWSNC